MFCRSESAVINYEKNDTRALVRKDCVTIDIITSRLRMLVKESM